MLQARSTYILALLLIAALLGGVALWQWGSDDERVSQLNAAFNYGLVVGAAVAGFFLVEQVIEARRSREDALRPVLVVTVASPAPEDGDDPARLRIRNIGPGPAIDVQVEVWVVSGPMVGDGPEEAREFIDQEAAALARDGRPAGLRYHGWSSLSIPANSTASVPIWHWAGKDRVGFGDRIRYRLSCVDVFGKPFHYPSEGFGHVWAREDFEIGDYEVHYSS